MFWFAGNLYETNKIELDCDDMALLYGATAFTTVRVYRQSLEHHLTSWQKHLDRLSKTIEKYEWQLPDWEIIRLGTEKLILYFPVIRIAIFPDGRELIIGRNLPPDLEAKQRQGIIAWLAEDSLYRRSLAEDKTGNYLGALLALQQAQKQGAKEAILLEDRQKWLETSTGNLWGWKDNCWWTPKVNNILPGIARSNAIEYLQSQNTPVVENDWTPDFIVGLETIAYSNCVVEFIPIQTIISSLSPRQICLSSAKHPELVKLRLARSDRDR